MTPEQYQQLREKIIGPISDPWEEAVREITLSDVLAAIGDRGLYSVERGAFRIDDGVYWDLSKSLEDQSDEVKQLLFSILCKP